MYRETNLFGVYVSPLLVYAAAALALAALVRLAMVRAQLYRFVWNPPLAEAALYVCLLGVLLRFL